MTVEQVPIGTVRGSKTPASVENVTVGVMVRASEMDVKANLVIGRVKIGGGSGIDLAGFLDRVVLAFFLLGGAFPISVDMFS